MNGPHAQPAVPASAQSGAQLRLFIALRLPDSIVEQIADLSTRLQKGIQFTGARPRWLRPDSFHLTLAFLGDRPASLVGPLSQALEQLAAEFPPQRLEIRQLGVFPHWHRPRVLWAGIRDRTRLLAPLHDALHRRLAPFDYEPENQAFRPHITLGRFKDTKALPAIQKLVHDQSDFRFGPFLADRLTLFRSELLPDGARHANLATATLAGPAPSMEAATS